MPAELDDTQREMLLEWMHVKGAFTYDDLAGNFAVNYYLARDWVVQLTKQGLVKKYPFKKGRKTQYVVDVTPRGDKLSPAVRVLFEGKPTELADLVRTFHGHPVGQPIVNALAHLYTRSYFSSDPTKEHLMGGTIPAITRSDLKEYRDFLERTVGTLDELIMNRVIWTEDSIELANRFGTNVPDIDKMLELANIYRKQKAK